MLTERELPILLLDFLRSGFITDVKDLVRTCIHFVNICAIRESRMKTYLSLNAFSMRSTSISR